MELKKTNSFVRRKLTKIELQDFITLYQGKEFESIDALIVQMEIAQIKYNDKEYTFYIKTSFFIDANQNIENISFSTTTWMLKENKELEKIGYDYSSKNIFKSMEEINYKPTDKNIMLAIKIKKINEETNKSINSLCKKHDMSRATFYRIINNYLKYSKN